jgi:glutamate dehydrogenase/leucine dehydrogenase
MQMDNGEIEVFNAYRVQHNNSRGPFKGGLRYHHQVDLDDVRRCVYLGEEKSTACRVLSRVNGYGTGQRDWAGRSNHHSDEC